LLLLTDLFRQADKSEREGGAKAVVVSNGAGVRRFGGAGEPRQRQRGAGGVIHGDAHRDIGGVVANAAFGDGLSEGFFKEQGD